MSNQDEVESFAAGMVEQRYGAMPEPARVQFVATVVRGLLAAVNTELIAALPDSATMEFDAWIARGGIPPEELAEMMEQSGVDTVRVARRAMLDYKEAFLAQGAAI